jgi:DNA-directed RNA polymerase subunit RPC12/RpoP
MCEVGARCPNCGQPELDADEVHCCTINGRAQRIYICHDCEAEVVVSVLVPESVRA